MNEEALKDSYDLFKKAGYTKSIDEYSELLRSNEEALNDSYSLFKKAGYTKSIEDFSVLVGATQPQPQEELTPEMMETGQRNAAPAYAMTEEKYAAEKKSAGESPLQGGQLPSQENTDSDFFDIISELEGFQGKLIQEGKLSAEYPNWKSMPNITDPAAKKEYNAIIDRYMEKYPDEVDGDDVWDVIKSRRKELEGGVSADVVEEPVAEEPVVEELPEDFDLAAELRKQTEIVGRDTREYGYIDPRKQMGAYPTKEFLDRANKQLLADQEFTAKKIEAEETTLAELRKKEEKQAEEERAIAEKANYELNLDEGFLKDLQVASVDMMGKKEEEVVPMMNDIYSKYGFSFRKTGIDNEMQVIADNGEKMFIELKPILRSTQIDSSRRLQKFLKDNAIPVTKEIAEVEKNEVKNAARALNLRKVGRLNDDGTESTVLMASGEVDGKYVAYPTLFPKDPESYTSAASSWMELDGMDAIKEAKNRNELFYFDTEEEAQKFAEGSWKEFSNADAEADLFFEKKGLNYMSYKNNYDRFEYALDRSEFLKEAPRFEDELTEDEAKKYGDLYVNGTLRSDAGKIQEDLEKEADSLRDFVNDKDYLVTRYEFDSYMQEKYEKKAQIAVNTNNISKAQIEKVNDMSVEFFGVPLNELSKYQPKTNEEVYKINSIVEAYNEAMTTRQMAANQYDVANTYLNEKFEKSIRGEWLENGAAFNDAVKKAWYNGRAADAIMMESLGFTDITQSGMSWNDVSPEEVAQKIIDALSETETGKNSIVAQRFHSSKNFKDIWDTFKDDPAELALTMSAESIAQLLPMGFKIVPTTTVIGVGVGAGIGATGFIAGPTGIVTTSGGALTGGSQGFRTGMSAVSFAMEYTNAVLDAVRNSDKGYDIMNVDDLATALQDEDIWREGREIGLKRGIPIAVVDYMTSGLAGRFLKVGSVASRTTRVAAGVGERFIYDPAAEALGEFTAQVVAGQDISLQEISAEALGGLGSKAPMAGINMYMDARNKTNVGIANDLADINFMANESSSDGAITKWANNMERLGHITAEQNQRIQENVAIRREARDLLNVGSGKVPMPFTASNKVQARTMELLAARDELTSTQNRRAVFGSKVAEINAELQELVTNKKLRPREKQTVLAGTGVTEASRQATGTDIREGIKTYNINDKAYTREEFLSRIADMSEKQLKKANVAVKNDDSVLDILRKKGKEIAQKVEETSVLRPKGDDEGVDLTAPTYEAPTQVTSPTAEAFATVNRNDGKGTVTLTEDEYNAEMEKFAPAEEVVAPSEQITQKRQEDRDQVVLELQKAREDLGIYVDDQLFEGISEETENTVDKLDNGEQLTWAQAEKASKELYDKYKEIAAMKNDPNRMHTIEQIDNMLDFLGQEIDNLETYIQNEQANIEGETGVEPVAKAERKETTEPETDTQVEGAEKGISGETNLVFSEEAYREGDKKADIERRRQEELDKNKSSLKNKFLIDWLNDPLRAEGRRSDGVGNVSINPRKPSIEWSSDQEEIKLETKEERQLWIQWKEALNNKDNKLKRKLEQEIGELVAKRLLEGEINAKYDAELAALETELKKQRDAIQEPSTELEPSKPTVVVSRGTKFNIEVYDQDAVNNLLREKIGETLTGDFVNKLFPKGLFHGSAVNDLTADKVKTNPKDLTKVSNTEPAFYLTPSWGMAESYSMTLYSPEYMQDDKVREKEVLNKVKENKEENYFPTIYNIPKIKSDATVFNSQENLAYISQEVYDEYKAKGYDLIISRPEVGGHVEVVVINKDVFEDFSKSKQQSQREVVVEDARIDGQRVRTDVVAPKRRIDGYTVFGEDTPILSDKEILDAINRDLKKEQDAIQEQGPEGMDVQEPTRDRQAVGEGDVRETTEKVDTEEARLEQQIKDLEALVSEQKVDFRLRADADPDVVVDEVNQAIVDEMNDMEVVNAEIQFTTKEERKPIDANELNSRSNNDIKVVKIEDFDGVPFMFTISDQLTTGNAINPYTGEVITDLNGGIGFFSEDAAWANVNKDLADSQAKKAVSIYEANKEFFDNWWKQNPQYDGLVPMAVVKMGEESILSNEAVVRTLLQNIQKLPVKNRKKALSVLKNRGKERLKILKKKEKDLKKQEKNLPPAEKHEVRLYEEMFEFVKSNKPSKIDDILSRDFTKKIPLGARAILIKTIGTGKPNKPNQTKRVGSPKEGSVSAALIEGRPKEDNAAVSISSIVEAITDPQMKDIEPRQVVAITGVDVRNASAVKTNHKNYDWGVRGRLIGVLDKSIHATDAFPVTYNAAIRDVVSQESEGKRKSVGKVLSDSVPTQSGLSSSEFFAAKAKGNNQNAAKLFAFMNNAFPSVMMSTDKATFDNVMASEGVKKHLKGGEVVYGVTVGGDIYVNPDVHNSESQLFNTGIHEYGHVWTDYLQTTEKGKKLYARGVELVKQTEEYQKQLKIFNGDSKKAANEALAILIGNKGQSIADAAVNSKFQEFLLSMWKYIQSKFKLSEDLTIDEIQNMTLDEFIGTGLADIFSGKEIKLTDAQLKQLKNPEAAFSKNQSMQSIIDAGRANNFADSVIIELLKRKGYDIADINAAMGINAKKRVESIETLRKRIARMKDINEARELVAKEMRAILRDSGISKYSKRTVNKVITNLKNANVNNMQKMLDGVSESIQNDKDRVERAIRYKRRAAAIKKLKSMGALKDLQAPLISLFKTDPKYLSEQTRQIYDAIINDIVNVNKKFEDRMSRDELLSSVEKVVREYSNDLSRASSVAQRIENDIDTDISTKQNLDKLLKDGKISDSEYELMTRFSDMLKESKEDTGLSEAEKLQKEEAKRQAINDDFNEAMSSMPSKIDNLNDDERKVFKFAQTLTQKDIDGLSLEAARRLVRGIELLNAGIVGENILKGKLIVEGNRDGNSVPITETSESGIIDKTASKIRTEMSNLFKSSKRDKGKAVENRLRSVPLRNLDQALKTAAKRFKSTGIYKNIFNPTAVAFESVKSNLKDIQKELQNATGLLSKNQNERFKQKAKLVMYQIQREFDSNPENKEVNPAKGWIEATLKDKDSIYDESEKKIIKDLMDEFLVDGEIDAQKIFDSFTDKEKRALKIIDNQYEKIQDMAEMDAAMQGLPFIKRQNYVHLPKVTNSESSMAKEFDDFAATLSNPSLKSKLLAQRSGRVHSISFDPIETAYSASRKTVTGYHMYPIVKRAKIAFANMRNRATTKAQNDIVDSLESIYDGIVRSQYQNVSKNSVAVENVINLMMKSGYLAQLASVRKAAVELTTNALHAAIANPINFVAGIKATSGIDRKTLDAAIKNLPTAEKTRITGDADLTSKDVESNLMTGSQIFKAEETTSDFMASARVVGKAVKTVPQKIIEFNEGLVAKPDVIVARPLFVGVFNDKFKEITGQAPNWDKIANDKAYREKFEYAINEATFDADQAVVDSAASNNPFAGIPKNVRDQNASAIKQAVMLVDRYMTRFRVFEYYSALRGVQALMGRSDITRLQGAALLSATVLRMAAYKLAMDAAINMVYQALGIDDDEDELDKYDVSRQGLGAVVTLALGRGFGNLAQIPINYGVEYLNKEYGEGITREGDYNKYKDGVVYSKVSVAPESGDDIVADAVISSLGSYTPFAKTIARGGVLLTRGATSKKEETREKNMGEFYERIPFEVAGNLGVIPSYRDFRSIYLKNMAKEYKEMKDTSYEKLLKSIPKAGKEKKNTSYPFSYPEF